MSEKSIESESKGVLVKGYAEHLSRNVLGSKNIKKIRTSKGIYALYKKGKLMYIGLAGMSKDNKKKRLITRIGEHRKKWWDSFSLFSTRRRKYTKDLETLLLHLTDLPKNTKKGKFKRGTNYIKKFKLDKDQ
jgi:hypothetical protein